MSRRESCVWHPMPEEVRRSSVQSRRASLAAGRRKSLNANEPDWDVEAPPTPPRGDYSARGHAHEAEESPAAAPAVYETPSEAAAAEPSQQSKYAEEDERKAATPAREPEPEEESKAAVLQAGAEAEAEAIGKGRTRHTVRFHGEKWAKVLRKCRPQIEAAFLEDIKEGASVGAEEAQRLKIKMHDCMEVTFVVYSESRARQKDIHAALQSYSFPRTCKQYTSFE